MAYFIYILSREVEINGVVSDGCLTFEDLKTGSDCFENSEHEPTLKIVDVKQWPSLSLQDCKSLSTDPEGFG